MKFEWVIYNIRPGVQAHQLTFREAIPQGRKKKSRQVPTNYHVEEVLGGVVAAKKNYQTVEVFSTLEDAKNFCEVSYRIEKGAG